MDAPAHFSNGGRHVSDFKLDELMGPGIKIDISSRTRLEQKTNVLVFQQYDFKILRKILVKHTETHITYSCGNCRHKCKTLVKLEMHNL